MRAARNQWLAEPMLTFAERGAYTQGGPRFYVPEGDGTHRRMYERIVIRRIGEAQPITRLSTEVGGVNPCP